jgi:hypothetical protein
MSKFRPQIVSAVMLGLMLLVGCSGVTPSSEVAKPTDTAVLVLPTDPPAALEIAPTETPVQEVIDYPTETSPPPPTADPAVTAGPDCLGDTENPVAASIADDYEFVEYEEVMTWFCNGAAFDDIATALLTEELSGVPTEELLVLLADDFIWDEIWQLIGLTEE